MAVDAVVQERQATPAGRESLPVAQEFDRFNRMQNAVRLRMLGPEQHPITPEDVGNMTEQQVHSLSGEIQFALGNHSHARLIAHDVSRGINEIVTNEKKWNTFWESEAARLVNTDQESGRELKRNFLRAVTARMQPPFAIENVALDAITVKRMLGGVSMQMPPELFASIAKPEVWEGRGEKETDEQAYLRIVGQDSTVARLFDTREIAPIEGLPEGMRFVIGHGNFDRIIRHETEESLDERIADSRIVKLYIPDGENPIAGIRDPETYRWVGDLAARLNDGESHIAIGRLGVTPADFENRQSAVRTVATLTRLANSLLEKYPHMRQQLVNEAHGGLIALDRLVTLWDERLNSEDANHPSAQQIITKEKVTPEQLRVKPDAGITFGRDGRSIFDTYTLEAKQVIAVPDKFTFSNGEIIQFPDGRTVEITETTVPGVGQSHVIAAGGQVIVINGILRDKGGTKIDDVVVKQVYFNESKEVTQGVFVTDFEREGALELLKNQDSAEKYFNKLMDTYGITPTGIPSDKALEEVVTKIRDLLRPRSFGPNGNQPGSAPWESFLQKDFDVESTFWQPFIGKLQDELVTNEKLRVFPFGELARQSPIELQDPQPPHANKFVDNDKRKLLDALKRTLMSMGKENQDNTDPDSKVNRYRRELQMIRHGFENYIRLAYRANTDRVAKLYGVFANRSDDPFDPDFQSLEIIEQKKPTKTLENMQQGEWKQVFRTIDSRLGCFVQVCDAVRHIQFIEEDNSDPSNYHPELRAVHMDLNPANILIGTDAASGEFADATVTDLGTAHIIGDPPPPSMRGKPPWFPPEQPDNNNPIRETNDVYTLGLLLYKIYTGVDPAPPGAILADPKALFTDLNYYRAGLSDEQHTKLRAIFAKATAPKPGDRYQNAQELYDAALDLFTDYQVNTPFPKIQDYQNANEGIEAMIDYFKAPVRRPADSGAVSLSEMDVATATKDTPSEKVAQVLQAIKEVAQAVPPPADAIRCKDAVTQLNDFVTVVEHWDPPTPEFAQAVRLKAAEQMGSVLVFAAEQHLADGSNPFWDEQINTVAGLVAGFDHAEAGQQTENFMKLFVTIADRDPNLSAKMLTKLAEVTQASNGWANTEYRNRTQTVVDQANAILDHRGSAVDYGILLNALSVIGALPDAHTPNHQNKLDTTDSFFDGVGKIVQSHPDRADEVMQLMKHLSQDPATPWDNQFLNELQSVHVIDVIDGVVKEVAKKPGEPMDPDWMETTARLAGQRMTRAKRADALAQYEIALHSMLTPDRMDMRGVLLEFERIGTYPEFKTDNEFTPLWTVGQMSTYLEGRLAKVDDEDLNFVLEVAGKKVPEASQQAPAAQRAIELLQKLIATPGHEGHTLDTLIQTFRSPGVSNQEMFREELVAVAQACIDKLVPDTHATDMDSRFAVYAYLVANTDFPTDPRPPTEHLISLFPEMKKMGWRDGADLVSILEEIEDPSRTPPYRNALLREPAMLADAMEKIIRASIDAASPEFEDDWLVKQREYIKKITPGDTQAKEYFELLKYLKTKPDSSKAVLGELQYLYITTPLGGGLDTLSKTDLEAERDDALTQLINNAETDALKPPPNPATVKLVFSGLSDVVSDIENTWGQPDLAKRIRLQVAGKMRDIILLTVDPADPVREAAWDVGHITDLGNVVAGLDLSFAGVDKASDEFLELFSKIVTSEPSHAKEMLTALQSITHDSETWSNNHIKESQGKVVEQLRAMLRSGKNEIGQTEMQLALEIVDALPITGTAGDREQATEDFLDDLPQLTIDIGHYSDMLSLLSILAQDAPAWRGNWKNQYLEQIASIGPLLAMGTAAEKLPQFTDDRWIRDTVRLAGPKLVTSLRPSAAPRIRAQAEKIITDNVGKTEDTAIDDTLSALESISTDAGYTDAQISQAFSVEQMSGLLEAKMAVAGVLTQGRLEQVVNLAAGIDSNSSVTESETAAQSVADLLVNTSRAHRLSPEMALDVLHTLVPNAPGALVANEKLYGDALVNLARDSMIYLADHNIPIRLIQRLETYSRLAGNAQETGATAQMQAADFIDLLDRMKRKTSVHGDYLIDAIIELRDNPPKNEYLRPENANLAKGMQRIIYDAATAASPPQFNDAWLPVYVGLLESTEKDPENEQLLKDFQSTMHDVASVSLASRTPILRQLEDIVRNRLTWRAPGLDKWANKGEEVAEYAMDLIKTSAMTTSTAHRSFDKEWFETTGRILGTYTTRDKTRQVDDYYALMTEVIRDEKVHANKADRMRGVVAVLDGIDASGWRNNYFDNKPDRIQVYSEMIKDAPANIPPLTVAEVQDWSEKMINLTGGFAALDAPTKTVVADIFKQHADQLNSDNTKLNDLLNFYEKYATEPGLEACFDLIQKSKLIDGLQGMVYSGGNLAAGATQGQLELLGRLAAQGLSAAEYPDPTKLNASTETTVAIFEKAEEAGRTRPELAQAAARGLASILDMTLEHPQFRDAVAPTRLRAVRSLIDAAWSGTVGHNRFDAEKIDTILRVIGANVLYLYDYHSNLLANEQETEAKRYAALLNRVADNADKKAVVEPLARNFASRGDFKEVDTGAIGDQLIDILRKCLS